MKNELLNNQEIKIHIINSLNQSREKWFELLKESLDNDELRNEIMNKIDTIDNRIEKLNESVNYVLHGHYELLADRLKEVEKQIVKKSKHA